MALFETLTAPRIGRLALLACLLVVSALHQIILLVVGHPLAGHDLTWLHAIASIPAAMIGWILAVKRAHDLDHSAWWLAVLSAIYIALIAFLALGGMTTLVAPALGVDPRLLSNVRGMFSLGLRLKLAVTAASVATFWPVLIKLLFYAGTTNINRYGAPPNLRNRLLSAPQTNPPDQRQSATSAPSMPIRRQAARHAVEHPRFGRRS